MRKPNKAKRPIIRIKKTKPKGGLVKIFQFRLHKNKWRFVCVAIGNESFARMVKELMQK